MKRKLFDELKEGVSALQSVREGKHTLREHLVENKSEMALPDDSVSTGAHSKVALPRTPTPQS